VVEVGGPATINNSLRAVAIGGEVILIGFLTEDNPGIDHFQLKGSGATVRSISVGDRASLEALLQTMSMTQLRSVIDQYSILRTPKRLSLTFTALNISARLYPDRSLTGRGSTTCCRVLRSRA
jgi:D-arabinose 1-dehydrogenase-like Zn-dependent alcohol dehydrogenase